MKNRRVFGREFKLEAVKEVDEQVLLLCCRERIENSRQPYP